MNSCDELIDLISSVYDRRDEERKGLSAYQIFVAHNPGTNMTESEWLDSLRCEPLKYFDESENDQGSILSVIGTGKDMILTSDNGAFRLSATGDSRGLGSVDLQSAHGDQDVASGMYSTVGGGTYNMASGDWSSVGSGNGNRATEIASGIGCGTYNVVSGGWSWVGGGYNNVVSGNMSTIASGMNNVSSGDGSSIGGGENNRASGDWSSIPGGQGLIADGPHQISMGRYNLPSPSSLLTVGSGQVLNRRNALELSWSGDLSISGNLNTNGLGYSEVYLSDHPIPPGSPVFLSSNGQVRPTTPTDDPDRIIGVVSGASSVLGNSSGKGGLVERDTQMRPTNDVEVLLHRIPVGLLGQVYILDHLLHLVPSRWLILDKTDLCPGMTLVHLR